MQEYGRVSINRNSNTLSTRDNTFNKMKNIKSAYYNVPSFENKGTIKHVRPSKNARKEL